MIPFDGLIDRRNDEPMFFAGTHADPDRESDGFVSRYFPDRVQLDEPESRTCRLCRGFTSHGFEAAGQDYIVEVWIEKSTQNDWLVPLCQRRGVNLVVGIGEQSETRSRELALRSSEYGAPVRIIYISDFDPGGRSMPKAVARKVEFTHRQIRSRRRPSAYPAGADSRINAATTACRARRSRTPSGARTSLSRPSASAPPSWMRWRRFIPASWPACSNAELDNWLDTGLQRRVAVAKGNVQSRL